MRVKPRKKLIVLFVCVLSFQAFGQGNGWEWQNPLPQGNTLQDAQFLDAQTGWVVGHLGTILKTINGGQNLAGPKQWNND